MIKFFANSPRLNFHSSPAASDEGHILTFHHPWPHQVLKVKEATETASSNFNFRLAKKRQGFSVGGKLWLFSNNLFLANLMETCRSFCIHIYCVYEDTPQRSAFYLDLLIRTQVECKTSTIIKLYFHSKFKQLLRVQLISHKARALSILKFEVRQCWRIKTGAARQTVI